MQPAKRIIFGTLLVGLLTGCDSMFTEPPANDPESIFENLWTTFNEEYAPFEERNVNWQEVYRKYRPKVNSNTTDGELFKILSAMLEILNDGHVSLTAPNRDIFYSNKIKRDLVDNGLFNVSVLKSYLEHGYKEGAENSFIYGKIKNENLAYIYFDHVGQNFFKLSDFLNDYPDVLGYIIDLRHNQGGDFTYCLSEMGRLTDQKRLVFKSKTKNGKGEQDYDAWYEWYIYPKDNYVNKPIVVLTDRYTLSAGERTVMVLRSLPNVQILGDTTNGAHGTMIGRELANGWFYSLVPQKVKLSDNKSYEGVGLAPDIYIKNKQSGINMGIDDTLERAVEILR